MTALRCSGHTTPEPGWVKDCPRREQCTHRIKWWLQSVDVDSLSHAVCTGGQFERFQWNGQGRANEVPPVLAKVPQPRRVNSSQQDLFA